jgi:hypothetical protein
MPQYQLKYGAGDEIIVNGRYHTILDVDEEDNEYYLAWKGRFRWQDAQEIDATAEPRN